MRRQPLLATLLVEQCRLAGLKTPETEYRFCPPRRWRFDFAWPAVRIALEIEGGIWTGGRHVRGLGYTRDLEKYNAAHRLNWRVFRFTPRQIEDGSALAFLQTVEELRVCNNEREAEEKGDGG
jgi:very-short-patch-repair endonuclease